MKKRKQDHYSDFSNVKHQKDTLIPEEFPEGAAGESIDKEKPITSSKSTPWHEDQRRDSAFIYPDHDLHDGLPRQAPGAHPTHQDPDVTPSEDD